MKRLWNRYLQRPELFLLVFILIVASVIRFYNYSSDITADEMSSIDRAQYSSLDHLIEQGVRVDAHPAFTQFFLFYWIKLLGVSDAVLRFPFILFGILTVFFTYLIGARWFSKTTGLFSAAAIAFLEFPITYSQLVRPYSPGVLFSLMTIYFWTLFLFEKTEKNKLRNSIAYIVSFALCIYSHHFSALLVAIVAITGLFFLNKKNRIPYLLCHVAIALLYVPHIPIFIQQLGYGGLGGNGGWLGKPESDYLLKFFYRAFNQSGILIFVFFIIFFITIIRNWKRLKWTRFHSFGIGWFLVVFFIGYYYSILYNPVLQHSGLLFPFPLFIIFSLSYFNDRLLGSKKAIELLLFAIVGLFSLIIELNFFNTHRLGVLKPLAKETMYVDHFYGEKNITHTANVSGSYYLSHFFSQEKKKPSFISYGNEGREDLNRFQLGIDTAKTDFFLYTWSTRYSPLEITEMIKEKYPFQIKKKYYFNSEFYLFSKNDLKSTFKNDSVFFESVYKNTANDLFWIGNDNTISDTVIPNRFVVVLDSVKEYSPTFIAKVGDIVKDPSSLLHFSALVYKPSSNAESQFVIAINNKNTQKAWFSNSTNYFLKDSASWKKSFLSIRLPENIRKDDILKVYVWNNKKKPIFISDMKIKVAEGNPIIYGRRTW